jgi:hypothetical protein
VVGRIDTTDEMENYPLFCKQRENPPLFYCSPDNSSAIHSTKSSAIYSTTSPDAKP